MISKEERAELRKLVESMALPYPWEADVRLRITCDAGQQIEAEDGTGKRSEFTTLIAAIVNAAPRLLDALDASDERIAGLEKDNDIYQDANIRLTKEFEQERATLGRKNRALKHEIRKLHRAREQDWEAGKRWRKEFIEDHARLGKEYVALQARIAELEAEVVRQEDSCKSALAKSVLDEVIADERVNAAKARIAELEAAAQWRPIEEAPYDVELLLTDGANVISGNKYRGWWNFAKGADFTPTHWLPIPALPEGGV